MKRDDIVDGAGERVGVLPTGKPGVPGFFRDAAKGTGRLREFQEIVQRKNQIGMIGLGGVGKNAARVSIQGASKISIRRAAFLESW